MGFVVEDYRLEGSRPEHDQDQARRAYLDRLTDADYLVVFLSKKHLKSPW